MNKLARTLTNTGTNQRVLLSGLLAQAYFATACQWGLNYIVAYVKLQMSRLFECFCRILVSYFEHNILNSS